MRNKGRISRRTFIKMPAAMAQIEELNKPGSADATFFKHQPGY
jgi:hypothetical protein